MTTLDTILTKSLQLSEAATKAPWYVTLELPDGFAAVWLDKKQNSNVTIDDLIFIDFARQALPLLAQVCREQELAIEKMHHALANAHEWSISDPEDSEMDRDAQIDNWIEQAFYSAREAQAKIAKLIEGSGI